MATLRHTNMTPEMGRKLKKFVEFVANGTFPRKKQSKEEDFLSLRGESILPVVVMISAVKRRKMRFRELAI
jgi:hypothetical protein